MDAQTVLSIKITDRDGAGAFENVLGIFRTVIGAGFSAVTGGLTGVLGAVTGFGADKIKSVSRMRLRT